MCLLDGLDVECGESQVLWIQFPMCFHHPSSNLQCIYNQANQASGLIQSHLLLVLARTHRYKAMVDKGLSRFLAFLREEEERELLEEIERLKPIGTPVGSYLEYR